MYTKSEVQFTFSIASKHVETDSHTFQKVKVRRSHYRKKQISYYWIPLLHARYKLQLQFLWHKYFHIFSQAAEAFRIYTIFQFNRSSFQCPFSYTLLILPSPQADCSAVYSRRFTFASSQLSYFLTPKPSSWKVKPILKLSYIFHLFNSFLPLPNFPLLHFPATSLSPLAVCFP